jgi:hypothetical protein
MDLSSFTAMIIDNLSPAPEDFIFEGMTFDYVMKNENEVVQMSMMFLEAIGYKVYYSEYADAFMIQQPAVH